MRHWGLRRWVAAILAATVSLSLGCVCQVAYASEKPVTATVLAVKAGSACFSDAVKVTGYFVPRDVAIVNVPGEGFKIADVLVSAGDRVFAGQPLAHLKSMSPANSGELTLKAPEAGVIMSRSAIVGAVASARAGPLFRIIVNDEIELQVDVPSRQLTKLNSGATARISTGYGPELNGRVRLVGSEINPQTQFGEVRLSVDHASGLRVGMFGRATIAARRSCGIAIPSAAVSYRSKGPSVHIVVDNMIETRRIQVGLRSNGRIEVNEGLRQGDIVVANAGNSLRDGDHVKVLLGNPRDQALAQ